MKYSDQYLAYDKTILLGAFEAVLFAAGEPVSSSRLREIFEITASEVELVASELEERLESARSGLSLVRCEDCYQLLTRIEHKEAVTRLLEIKRNAAISRPALEALAVIAYRQPVTKSFVEKIRGVDCSGIINTLVEKGLAEEKGRLEAPGRPILYGTTLHFLKCFGLGSLSELPELSEDGIPVTTPENGGSGEEP